jgi:hypothetical protein
MTGPQRTHSKTAQKILGAQKQLAAPTLFLGNLPFETTEDEIWQLLDAHRPRDKKGKRTEAVEEKSEDWIRKIRMGTFEDSGLCKGYVITPPIHFSKKESIDHDLLVSLLLISPP